MPSHELQAQVERIRNLGCALTAPDQEILDRYIDELEREFAASASASHAFPRLVPQ